MSDTPCVDGCGQDAATIERLREQLAEAVEMAALIERAVERSAYNCTCQVGGVDAMSIDTDWLRETARRLRAALAPQNRPRSAADAPEAPGQPGRGERAAGGHVEALADLLWGVSNGYRTSWTHCEMAAESIQTDPGPLLVALAEAGVLTEVTAPLKRNRRGEWAAVYDGNHTTEGRRYATEWEAPDARA